ncbi:uncharacterized protein LOC130712926 [Lotus japonicus]|uniref:uncharacterized protein LOC130712926 n=1 Tax=Lotus japonicus TaxID=34305 RepID=UPI00258BC217|nr:uncharacterized protein LOC130712926 [Lotus japonicus]
MGLHTSSSTQSKKNSRTPSKKHYKSRATPMQNPEAPVPEDVSNTSVSANDEDDVATSSHGSDETLSDKPAKEVSLSKDSSSSSKSSDSKAANSTDVLSEESMKTPAIVHDVSDDEDSEDVPLASVSARMLKRRRASVEETPVVQKKKDKITTGSSKSRATDVSRKGKQKAVESRVAKKKEIASDVLACKEIIALIAKAGLRKTVMNIGKCYDKLVKEFIVNLSNDVNNPASPEFRKVIGVVNWVLSNHTSVVSTMLAKLIYRIGTEIAYDFGNFVFSQTLKHAETCAVKLPISFPSLLTAIILKQHANILTVDDVPVPKGTPITLDQRLFLEPHVLDIDLPSSRTSVPVSVSASGTHSVIAELEAISKELQETIRIAAARKIKVDALIQTLKGEAGQEGEHAADAKKEGSAENDEENSSSAGI